jgi:phosphoribosylamine--glycine ligase
VLLASGGYPEAYHNGRSIQGIKEFNHDHAQLFLAGVSSNGDELVTAGGRVLNVVAYGKDLATARQNTYKLLDSVYFKDCYYRKDIGEINL